MSKLLKDEISSENINKLAVLLKNHKADFDVEAFTDVILDDDWPELALKQRIRKVSKQMHIALQLPYVEALAIVKPVSVEFSGLFHLIFPDFVELFGQQHYEPSIQALALFTPYCSSEFAIRVFIELYPEQTKQQLLQWSQDDNEHLRRLASEGVRPKLPWAKQIKWIAEQPDWVLPILEQLKNDPSRYVQKSVANLLNDLSKTQKEWVLALCSSWSSDNSNTKWIIKHGLRTLLKQGDQEALSIIGYGSSEHIQLKNWILDEQVKMGQRLNFSFELQSSQKLGLLRLEYAIHFLRKRQQPYRKVFKIAESDIQAKTKQYQSRHDFKIISTRQYVAGKHRIELILNGKAVKQAEFELI